MLPTNINSCSFQRNVQENDHAIFKFVDHKICVIELVCSSTAYRQNNIHKTTHLQGHCKAFYMYTQHHFEFSHNKTKQCSNEEPKEMPLRVQLLSFFPLASTWESNTQFFLE